MKLTLSATLRGSAVNILMLFDDVNYFQMDDDVWSRNLIFTLLIFDCTFDYQFFDTIKRKENFN